MHKGYGVDHKHTLTVATFQHVKQAHKGSHFSALVCDCTFACASSIVMMTKTAAFI